MKTEILKHKVAYAFLFAGLSCFLATFMAAWPDKDWQRISVFGLILFYFMWGVITHVKTAALTRRVVLEYGAIAILGGFFLLILTI